MGAPVKRGGGPKCRAGTGPPLTADSPSAGLPGPGVTPNDPGDADTGPNMLQNFPVLERASTTQVRGRLDSRPGGTYRIEVFANQSCDPSRYGEGERFLGAVVVTTDRRGSAKF